MNSVTLQPNTIQALQNFITIWRQDPAAQYHLGIFSQNIILWNEQTPDQVINITLQLEETALNKIDQLIGNLDEPVNNVIPIPEKELDEPDPLAKIKEDLMQSLEPQEVSHILSFNNTI